MRISPSMFDALLLLGEHTELNPSGMASIRDLPIGKFRTACLNLRKLGLVEDRYDTCATPASHGGARIKRVFTLTVAGREAVALTRQLEALLQRSQARPLQRAS